LVLRAAVINTTITTTTTTSSPSPLHLLSIHLHLRSISIVFKSNSIHPKSPLPHSILRSCLPARAILPCLQPVTGQAPSTHQIKARKKDRKRGNRSSLFFNPIIVSVFGKEKKNPQTIQKNPPRGTF
jgi:hypothetical protein